MEEQQVFPREIRELSFSVEPVLDISSRAGREYKNVEILERAVTNSCANRICRKVDLAGPHNLAKVTYFPYKPCFASLKAKRKKNDSLVLGRTLKMEAALKINLRRLKKLA